METRGDSGLREKVPLKKDASQEGAVFSLAYLSRAVKPMSEAELDRLGELSRKNNAKRRITGLLLYDTSSIVQLLEGDEAEVVRLLKKIERDPRHRDLKVFAEGYGDERRMTGWSMAVRGRRDLPKYMAGPFDTFFRAMRNCPVMLGMTDQRVQFFQEIAVLCRE